MDVVVSCPCLPNHRPPFLLLLLLPSIEILREEKRVSTHPSLSAYIANHDNRPRLNPSIDRQILFAPRILFIRVYRLSEFSARAEERRVSIVNFNRTILHRNVQNRRSQPLNNSSFARHSSSDLFPFFQSFSPINLYSSSPRPVQ